MPDTTATPTTNLDGLTCEQPPDATVALPARYTMVRGLPTPVSNPAQVEVLTAEQVVERCLADCRAALVRVGYRLPDTTESFLHLVMQRGDMPEGKAPRSKPYNAKDLLPAGKALHDLTEELPQIGELLDVDQARLARAIERVTFVQLMREAIEWCLPTIATHEAHALAELAEIVDPTVEGVRSLLPRFPRMERILEDAILYKKGPSELAQQKRESNAKVAAAAVEGERSKTAATDPVAAPTPVVVAPVVVPQVPTPAALPPASGPPRKR